MATKNLVPRGDNEGKIGISSRKWSEAHFVSGSFDNVSISSIYGSDGTSDLIAADPGSSITVQKESNGTFTIGGGGTGSSAANKIEQDDTYIEIIDNGIDPGSILFYHDNILSWELYDDVLKPQLTNTVKIGSDQKRIKEIWLSEDQDALNIGASKIKFNISLDPDRLQLANDGINFENIITTSDLSSYLTSESDTLDDVVGRGSSTVNQVTINNVIIGSSSKEITDLISIKTTSNSDISIMPHGTGITQIGGTTAGTNSVDIKTGLVDLKSSTGLTSKINFYKEDNTNYITLQTDNTVTQNRTLTLPDESGTLATKSYTQTIAQGLKTQASVKVATTADIGGVGSYHPVNQTITNQNTLEALTIDTIALSINDRVLVKDQDLRNHNGIYLVTVVGDASTAWVLTRASEFNSDDSVSGFFTFVEQGATNADVGFVCTSDSPDDTPDGTDLIFFEQFSHAGQIDGGTGLTKVGNTLNVDAVLNHVTDVGTLTELTVAGLSTLDGGLKIKGDSTNYVTIGAPNTLGGNYTLTLPADVGVSNQVLQTDGGGTLSWVDQTSGGLNSVSEDLAPILGGNLTINSKSFTGNIVPTTTSIYDVGASDANWNHLYLSGNVYLGSKSSISNDNNGKVSLLVNDASKSSFEISTSASSTQSSDLILNNINSANSDRSIGQVRFQHNTIDKADIQFQSTTTSNKYKLNFKISGVGSSGTLIDRISIDTGNPSTANNHFIAMNMPLELKNVKGSDLNTFSPGEISLYEDSAEDGTNKITLKAPDSINSNFTLTLPGDSGSNGNVLSVNGSGNLSWIELSNDFTVEGVANTKSSIVKDDKLVISDSDDSNSNKKVTFSTLKDEVFEGFTTVSPVKIVYDAGSDTLISSIEDDSIGLAKIDNIDDNRALGNVSGANGSVSTIEIDVSDNVSNWADANASDDKLVSQKAVYDFVKSQNTSSQTPSSTVYEFTDIVNAITLDENAYQNVTTINLNTTGARNPNKHLVIYMPEAISAARLGQTVQLHLIAGPNWVRSNESTQNTQEILVLPNPNDPQLIKRRTDNGASSGIGLALGWGGFFNFTSLSEPHLVTTSKDDYTKSGSKFSAGMTIDGSDYARDNYDFSGAGPYTLGSAGLDFEDGNEPKSQNGNTIKLQTPLNPSEDLPPYSISLLFFKRSPTESSDYLWQESQGITALRNTGNTNNIVGSTPNQIMKGLVGHVWQLV